MSDSIWIGTRKPGRTAHEPGRALVRAAACGDSLPQLLDHCVEALLDAGQGDRAGLWLAGDRAGQPGPGRVIEASGEPVPARWQNLDISIPLLRGAMESPDPVVVEFATPESMPPLGPVAGMRNVVWIRLRIRNRTLGLCMVARLHPRPAIHIEALRTQCDEIALVLSQRQDSVRLEELIEELQFHSCLSRAIVRNVSPESILPQIARAARRFLPAEFVVLGRASTPATVAEGWDGPEHWRALLEEGPLPQTWWKVGTEGHELTVSAEELAKSIASIAGNLTSSSAHPFDRIVAMPVDVGEQTVAVLMAALAHRDDPGDENWGLERYALLAARAFEKELARGAQANWTQSFGHMIEKSGEALLAIDVNGHLLETSPAVRAVLRHGPGQLGAVPFPELFAKSSRDAVTRWHAQAIATGQNQPPLEADLAGGTRVRLHARSVVDARACGVWRLLVGCESIDPLLAPSEPAGRTEAEMLGLLESIDSGVLLLDAANNIRVVSERFAQIMGVEPRRLAGLRTFDELVNTLAGRFTRPAETSAIWRDHVLRDGQSRWDEFELGRPSRKTVERFARPLFAADGSRLGWLEIHRDISGQRLIQSKLIQTEKMAALGQLVSGIAHELNNPLTSIQGYAQLLLNRRAAPERAADARRIYQEAGRAGRIVKNLLLFAREAPAERRALSLNEVAERTLALRSYELKIENIVVELDLKEDLPQTLGDSSQLQQVLLNLILNAEQAIRQGRGRGLIRIRTMQLAGNRIALEIFDDGPGILPDVISRVFDPFFTTKPVGVGTGLGLSIVYGIVRGHGGEISVQSQPGEGTTFTIELPAMVDQEPGPGDSELASAHLPSSRHAAPAVIAAHSPDRRAPGAFRILAVEDEPTVAQLIADVLTEEGYRVDALLDSRAALTRMEENHYDLIICDLKMPYLNGPALYRALVRSRNPLRHRLLFVTGDTMSPHSMKFLGSNGLPYLAKPFLVEELKQVVRRALAEAPGAVTAEAVVGEQ